MIFTVGERPNCTHTDRPNVMYPPRAPLCHQCYYAWWDRQPKPSVNLYGAPGDLTPDGRHIAEWNRMIEKERASRVKS